MQPKSFNICAVKIKNLQSLPPPLIKGIKVQRKEVWLPLCRIVYSPDLSNLSAGTTVAAGRQLSPRALSTAVTRWDKFRFLKLFS